MQVLRNLIGNAISFSPPNGQITLHAAANGKMVRISVSDQGPGIPQAKLDSIFDRFYSERPKSENFGQHSGLGLSISRQIIEALHGSIAVENLHDHKGHKRSPVHYRTAPRAEPAATLDVAGHGVVGRQNPAATSISSSSGTLMIRSTVIFGTEEGASLSHIMVMPGDVVGKTGEKPENWQETHPHPQYGRQCG